MADEVKKLSGEERVDALCAVLEEKYGMHLPKEVFSVEDEDAEIKKLIDADAETEEETETDA